jgi:hypothetical protein
MAMTSPAAPPAYSPQPGRPPQPSNGLAVAALVVGIVAFLLGLLPIAGLLLGAGAIVLGVVALRRPNRKGLAILGLILGSVAALTSLVTTVALIAGLASGGSSADAARAAADSAAPGSPTAIAAEPTESAAPVETVAPQAKETATPKPETAGVDYGGYPKSEARFVKVVEKAAEDYADTSNELKGAKILKSRDSDACEAAGSKVKSWVGTIHEVGATGDGDGYVEIEIAPSIVVETWNNALSDAFDDTLIPQSAAFFDRLSEMDEGDKVVFSGKLLPDDDSCLQTSNLTKAFNAADPNFLFRFSNIRAQ